MSGEGARPARLAIWLLRHACPGSDHEALTGDLLEQCLERRSPLWIWRQVFLAIAVNVLVQMRRYWPHILYAVVGAEMRWLLGEAVLTPLDIVPWWTLPWPWSMVVFKLIPDFVYVLAALPVLGLGLAIQGTFRWRSLLWTGALSMGLVAIGVQSIVFPALFQPVSADRLIYTTRILPIFMLVLGYSGHFFSAWLGCRWGRQGERVGGAVLS